MRKRETDLARDSSDPRKDGLNRQVGGWLSLAAQSSHDFHVAEVRLTLPAMDRSTAGLPRKERLGPTRSAGITRRSLASAITKPESCHGLAGVATRLLDLISLEPKQKSLPRALSAKERRVDVAGRLGQRDAR